MNITMISTDDRAAAREKARQYRAAANISHDETDAATARAYKAMAQGHRILDLYSAFNETGVDDLGRPRLAIARATWQRVFFEKRVRGGGLFSSVQSWEIRGQRKRGVCGTDHVSLDEHTFDAAADGRIWAVVPTIPPEHRPRHNLRGYHLLFEAAWSNIPTDPLLLRHLVGSLFVVLAAWDLTEIERLVLTMIERGRRR